MKDYKKLLFAGIVSSTMLSSSASAMEPVLTPTQLHAVLGVVTNFILDDGITHNGTSYGTVTSPYTGRVWLDRNLGAQKLCASSNDTQCYGDYYQWGRNFDGHEKSNSYDYPVLASNVTNVGHGDFITNGTAPGDWASVDTTGVQRTTNWSATDGSSVCPADFRVPTIAELNAELFDVGSAEISYGGDAFYTFLALPSAGKRDKSTATVAFPTAYFSVWSSSVSGLDSHKVSGGIIGASSSTDNRANAYSIRCIKAKIHKHNGTTYGEVISPYTGKVWLDRNLGANRVCTNQYDAECYGDYYQWGRNFDGHQEVGLSSTTSALASNITNVGHGDFIFLNIPPKDWASVDLAGTARIAQWSATDGSSICPTGFRVPTDIELQAELLDVGSAEIANHIDAFNSFLKFPTAGIVSSSYSFQGAIWTNSVSGAKSKRIFFDNTNAYLDDNYNRFDGLSVRCMKD